MRAALRFLFLLLAMAALVGGYIYAKRFAEPTAVSRDAIPVSEAPKQILPGPKQPLPANPPARTGPPAPAALRAQINALGNAFGGETGISVRSVESGWTAGYNGQRPFPQQSVSKLWVAAAILDKIDAGEMSLTDPVTVTPADLTIFHQPIRARMTGGAYRSNIAELLRFAMTQSDNTANDILFRAVGGKAGVEAFFARKGLTGITMSSGEKELQMAVSGMRWDPRFSYGKIFWQVRETVPFEVRAKAITAYVENPMDGAAPDSVAGALVQLRQGKLLSPASSAYLIELMNQSKTGPKRLRGGLSPGWQMAHKTGTGQVLKLLATAFNDVGIMTSPSGKHYAVAVMIGATNRTVAERQEFMQAVTRAVIACEAGGQC